MKLRSIGMGPARLNSTVATGKIKNCCFIPEYGLEHVCRQVLARVDALVLLHKHVRRDLHLGVGVVEGGVEHDDREGEDETGVRF